MNKDIEIEEDLEHQKKAWIVKRIGFIVIFILILVSLSGVFSSGMFSSAEIVKDDILINYDKFIRAGAPAEMLLNIKSAGDSLISVLFSNNFIQQNNIDAITPQPDNEIISDRHTIFNFMVTPYSNGIIKFNYKPKTHGILDFTISYQEHLLPVKQIIYP